jgi:hypothetical protein
MQSFFRLLALCALLLPIHAYAQGNVLGLPAVPQTPIAEPQPAASGAGPKPGASAAAAQPQVTDADIKSVLNGGVIMASSYTSTLATVRITTNTPYKGDARRKQALTAARLVQRDVRVACGKQCKPASMPAPKILPDGKLQFDMVIDGLARALSNDDMMGLLLGRPLPVVAAGPGAAASAAAKPIPAVSSARAAAPAVVAAPVVRDPPALPVAPDPTVVSSSVQSTVNAAESAK